MTVKLQPGGQDELSLAAVQQLFRRMDKLDRKLNFLIAVVVGALLPFAFYVVLLFAGRLQL
jgi:hypothetical protein